MWGDEGMLDLMGPLQWNQLLFLCLVGENKNSAIAITITYSITIESKS